MVLMSTSSLESPLVICMGGYSVTLLCPGADKHLALLQRTASEIVHVHDG